MLWQDQQKKRKDLTDEQKKTRRESDRAQAKTRVGLGQSFNTWTEMQNSEVLKTDPESALVLLDRYIMCSVNFVKRKL